MARSTEETLAPTPAPAAAPQTMNTYRNEAKHSLMMDLQEEKKRKRERESMSKLGVRDDTTRVGACHFI